MASQCEEEPCRHVFDACELPTWQPAVQPPYCTAENDTPENHAAWDHYWSQPPASGKRNKPPFRAALGKTNTLSESGVSRTDVLRMIKRRAKAAGLSDRICCHTFRATGITAYLEAGGTIENAQAIAAHESPRTTKLYDRTSDELTLDEVERIAI